MTMRALLLVLVLASCATPTAPKPEPQDYTLVQYVTDRDGRVWAIRAHYAVCPDTTGTRPPLVGGEQP